MVQEMALCIADNENNRDLLRVANDGNPSSKGLFRISNRLT